ncbi:hypothetical protein BW730_14900 [Tessaracoccus aquimaris]|uniref:DUF4956 domain-containing protein n=1 Tax=Tessaracoccus aquimaris TaxID=1332264 RepID=A0A1Q2CR60_9ACTN|nr:DUF4956 domain-containing protein [Tessaracoccus aquimaris]AQP48597.1 hypothetical protein BW730_14900 [Tessaracoccus aquimaris]
MFTSTSLIAIAADLIAIVILAGPLYYRRHRRRDLMFAFITLNVGVMVVAAALGSSAGAGAGLGLGLFGVLSIIRLRSDPISQAEVAYYFGALALGLIGGLAPGSWWVTPVLAAGLLTVIAIADSPHLTRSSRSLVMTLDVAVLDRDRLERIVGERVGGIVRRLDVREIDLVRDLTILEVWYRPITNPRPVPTPPHGQPAAAWTPNAPQSPSVAAPTMVLR